MAYLDRHDVNKALVTMFNANAALKALIGDPVRMGAFIPANATFPFVRVDFIPSTPLTGHMSSTNAKWIRRHTIQFTIFGHDTSLDAVAAIQKAIADLMDYCPTNATVTNGVIGSAIPGLEHLDYSPEDGSAVGVLEYTLSIEATS